LPQFEPGMRSLADAPEFLVQQTGRLRAIPEQAELLDN
jgi:hypothetical protein